MIPALIRKELRATITGPRFTATFTVCAVLILLSIIIGIRDYKALRNEYEAGQKLSEQRLQEQTNWMFFSTRIHRAPDPMHIFVSGVNYDIGRRTPIQSSQPVKLTHSVYSDDPIFAVFRFIDLTFIFQFVLSLLAILFTYNAVNGEKERGTLRLVFANPIPRTAYILAKTAGCWLGLIIPLLVPVLLGLLLVPICSIPMTGNHWIQLILFLGLALLYFSFFIVLGILVSTLTHRPSVSFLILLVIWVTTTLIIPRTGVAIAGKIVRVPTAAETDGQIGRYSRDRWHAFMAGTMEASRARQARMAAMNQEEQDAYRNAHMWHWMEESDMARDAVQQDISAMTRRLREALNNKRRLQEQLGLTLARISPAAVFQLAAMNLAASDVGMKARTENAMQQYHDALMAHSRKKLKALGKSSAIHIGVDSKGVMTTTLNHEAAPLELDDLPRFRPSEKRMADTVQPILPDCGLLIIFILLALGGGFTAFQYYDLR